LLYNNRLAPLESDGRTPLELMPTRDMSAADFSRLASGDSSTRVTLGLQARLGNGQSSAVYWPRRASLNPVVVFRSYFGAVDAGLLPPKADQYFNASICHGFAA